MYQKNKLKDLIYIQENKPCNEQTVKGLFRSIVEPILEKSSEGRSENNVQSLILCRLEEKSKNDFAGIFKRLEYSNAKVYDFSINSISEKFENVLKENIWDKTEFVYVLAERYGAVLIFDYDESGMENIAQIYALYNSKNLSDAFEIINSNSKIDLSEYQEKNHPDRRDNEVLNNSIRKIIENLNEINQEVLISEMEKEKLEDSTDLASRLEFISSKSNFVSHEIRNQLSICSLYSNIIEKQQSKIKFETDAVGSSVINALDCIQKALKMAGNLLLDLKSLKGSDLKEYDLKDLIEAAVELAKVYASGKEIEVKSEITKSTNILADENKFLAVLINLIKNAVESIEEKGDIIISTEIEEENAKIIISNTGKAITKELQERFFKKDLQQNLQAAG